jgi:GTP-binding protein
LKITSIKFLGSSPSYKSCAKELKVEFAFIGRSNVGKSSLINTLLNNSNVAKTSKKPGKTKLINHYLINQDWGLIDLPGYGWGADSKQNRFLWNKMTQEYLLNRIELKKLFLLIDSSIDPQPIDIDFFVWCTTNQINPTIVFSKIDKLSKSKIKLNINKHTQLIDSIATVDKLCISNTTKQGRLEMLAYIKSFL